jgi:YrbI family 3-deoxy-D-manno-octulosonate 8-phosphate phosphatase
MSTILNAKWVIIGDEMLWNSRNILTLPQDQYQVGTSIFLCNEKLTPMPVRAIPFSTYDGFAIKNILVNVLKIHLAIIVQSSDFPEIIQCRCQDLKIAFYCKGIQNKAQFIAQFCDNHQCALDDVVVFDNDLTAADFPKKQPGLLLSKRDFNDQQHFIRSFANDYGNRNPKVLSYYAETRARKIDCPKNIRSTGKKIRALICDIDGTCTDGFKIYAEDGSEWKCFSTIDILAIKNWNADGNLSFLITGESGSIPQKFAQLCHIPMENVFMNAGNQKVSILHQICIQHHLQFGEIAYAGDDMNDFGIIEHLIAENGIAACPANAMPMIKNIPQIILLKTRGGLGAVAEWIATIHAMR